MKTHKINDIQVLDSDNSINSINLYKIMEWVLDQDQETNIQLLKFVFSQSGLMSNKQAAKINGWSESYESQKGEKIELGQFKYAKIKK